MSRSLNPRWGRGRRGAVLIVVLGVLVLLSLLGITFFSMSSLENRVAQGYLDEVKAKLVARAGIDWAVGEIISLANRGAFNDSAMEYWGGNTAETGVPDWATPLELAKNCSWAWEDEAVQNPFDTNVQPLLVTLDGDQVGFTRAMEQSTYAKMNGDLYRLRVEDANSKIHVNDGADSDGTTKKCATSLNLKRILNNLGAIVGAPDAGTTIVDKRPPGGYRSLGELEVLLGTVNYRKIRPFVTTKAWVDRNVVNPVPLSSAVLSDYKVPYNEDIGNLFRYGRSREANGTSIATIPLRYATNSSPTSDCALYALDEVNAQWIERTSRAPVNINSAPEQVLSALIGDLRGWFVLERRKANPIQGDVYGFQRHPQYDYKPTSTQPGDEYGWLYSTMSYTVPGSSSVVGSGVPAEKVAQEIIACRKRQTSTNITGLDYSTVWWGGPFRTWRQFNAFCDRLVDRTAIGGPAGLLKDSRNIFYDYSEVILTAASPYMGPNTLRTTVSPLQQLYASQAMADVLKANFNPNCTLNELNPDKNLFLMVDKTDLISATTEFCFTPMGYFDIESEGVLVRTDGNADLLSTAVRRGQVISRKKVICSVRAFDAIRETTQSDFYRGAITARPANSHLTSNNRTMEIGPEPDNGPTPKETKWGGWLQLATQEGPMPDGQFHIKESIEAPAKGGNHLGSVLHGHFQFDHTLHDHGGGAAALYPLGVSGTMINNADRTEPTAGPYSPAGALSKGGTSYRLGNDWHALNKPAAGLLKYQAPSDLRIDGAYIERDSACMYQIDQSAYGSIGTVSMWVKPSYFPELAGKPRTLFSADTIQSGRYDIINGLWFLASQDQPAFQKSNTEGYTFFYRIFPSGYWRPASLACGFSLRDYIGGGIGTLTDSLNHLGHQPAAAGKANGCGAPAPNLLIAHHWTHVTYWWDMNTRYTKILVNGNDGSSLRWTEVAVHRESTRVYMNGGQFYTPNNCIRLGEPSRTYGTHRRNWAADATIDEFYMWDKDGISSAVSQWEDGRYYRASASGGSTVARFTSGDLQLLTSARMLPAASLSSSSPPVISGIPALPPPTKPGVTVSGTLPDSRILAVAWTWYPEASLQEAASGSGSGTATGPGGGTPSSVVEKPVMFDYLDYIRNMAPADFKTEVRIDLLVNGTPAVTDLKDDGASVVAGVLVKSTDVLKYQVTMDIIGLPPEAVLLGTPVFDDITIYFSRGLEYLSYELVETSL